MSEWQPIETAPKDGAWILVYEPGEWAPHVHVARWGIPEWSFTTPDKTWVTMALGPNPDTYNPEPTHWMPLPQPPIASTGDFKQNQGPT